jgi:phosphatidylserine decarboxylase precursor
MKIPSSQLKFYAGKNKSKKVYEVHHFYKDKIPANIAKSLKSQIDSKVFQADAGQQYIDHGDQIIYIGLGEEAKLTLRKLASYYLKLGEAFIKWVGIGLEIHISKELSEALSPFNLVYQLANSVEIAAFGVDSLSKTYRERKIEVGDISFVMENAKEEKTVKEALEKSKVVSKYLNESRYVAHLPANHFTPEEFVSRSQEIAKENKLKITVFDEDRLKKEKFGGILSVCQGSDKKAKMVILEYTPKGAKSTDKTLALIGKGLTFDSGGISIKPSAEMHEMKYDMCGAATAIHAIGAIASLGIKTKVIAAIGVAENMPDAAALKPGDVYTAYNGVTVEVQNTDAEGRLVLGDVIFYISKKFKPNYMVDLATLTGAVIIALGHEAAGVMTNAFLESAFNIGYTMALFTALPILISMILLAKMVSLEMNKYLTEGGVRYEIFKDIYLLILSALPKNLLSKLFGSFTYLRLPRFMMVPILKAFAKAYKINLSEAELNIKEYNSLNQFFTRSLKAGARIIDSAENAVVSPVDARITSFGDINDDTLIQAKGFDYSVKELLGSEKYYPFFENGKFITFYLSPQDYHRIHSPFYGKILGYYYAPGKLFPVNDAAVGGIRGLFPKNERLITFLQTEYGKIAVVKVGASNVGKIRVTYDTKIVTNKLIRFPKEYQYENVNIMIDKGSELGRFEMGSTVILVFENDTIDLNPFVKDERSTYGSTVGLFRSKIMTLPK